MNPYAKSEFGAGNYLGSDFQFLRGEYKNILKGSDPLTALFREQGKKDVGMAERRAINQMEAQEGASGFLGTNANAYNTLFESTTQALGDVNLKATQMEEMKKAQAREALLGMSQFEGSQMLGVDKAKEDIRQFDITTEEGRRQFYAQMQMKKRELDLAEEAQNGSFWDIAGSIVGAGVGFATGGIGAGFGSWLGNELFT